MKVKPAIVGACILIILLLSPLIWLTVQDWGWGSLMLWGAVVVVAHLSGMVATSSWNPWRFIWRMYKEDNN